MTRSDDNTANTRSPADLLRPGDVAREYGLGRDTVSRLIKNREIGFVADGEKKLIPRHEIDAWIARNSQPPAAGGAE